MKSVAAILVVAMVGSALAAPSGLYGHGHGVPLATSALVAGPSGVISSHQSNGAIAVAAPAVLGLGIAPGLGLGHGLGWGLGGHGLAWGHGGHGLGWGHGAHGW